MIRGGCSWRKAPGNMQRDEERRLLVEEGIFRRSDDKPPVTCEGMDSGDFCMRNPSTTNAPVENVARSFGSISIGKILHDSA